MRQANGFTLVELLAAMVAGSLLLATLSWTASSLARALPVASETLHDRQLERLGPVLTHMLEQVSPAAGPGAFKGDAKSLSAIVPPPLAAGPVGPLRFTLVVRPAPRGQALFAALEPVEPTAAFPADARRERLLLGGFAAIGFEYVAENGEKNSIPRLITLQFSDGIGNSRRISAAPRITSDGRCRFDPISMTCRL